jgi:hypothetical protein
MATLKERLKNKVNWSQVDLLMVWFLNKVLLGMGKGFGKGNQMIIQNVLQFTVSEIIRRNLFLIVVFKGQKAHPQSDGQTNRRESLEIGND